MNEITSLLFYILLIWIFFKLFLQKGYNKGLDDFNKEQEKIKPTIEENIKEILNFIQEDVIIGLHNLGYSRRLANKLIKSIPYNDQTAEELLREALNRLQPQTIINIKDSIVQRTNFNTVDDTKKVNYKPQTDFKINPLDIPEPLRRLTQWYPIVSEVKEIIEKVSQPILKAVKLKKVRAKTNPAFERLTDEDIKDLKRLLMPDIFKRFSYISLAWLKTKAIRQGIDDWISLIDSHLSYEENKSNLVKMFGAIESDKELMTKYQTYSDMSKDFYQDIGENHEFNLSR